MGAAQALGLRVPTMSYGIYYHGFCTICCRTHRIVVGDGICTLKPAKRGLVEWLLWALT